MTKQKSFKRLVRARMEKTGESYTAARASLLAADEPNGGRGPGDHRVRRRDPAQDRARLGGVVRPARRVGRDASASTGDRALAGRRARRRRLEPQSITVSYERARGMRAVGERADGFSVTASKTVAVPVERLFDAFVDETLRHAGCRTGSCASGPRRSRSRPASTGATARRASSSASSRRARRRASSALEHERLPDAEEAERMKVYWRERVAALKEVLEA